MPSPARTLHNSVPAPFAVLLVMALAPALYESSASAEPHARRTTPAMVRQSNDTHNRDVRIHNQTGWPMNSLSASSGGDWGSDLLGSGGLSPGRSVVVRIDDGSRACRYALRAQFDNGQSLQRGVNACEVADYYFTR